VDNFFDDIRALAVDVVLNTMGYDATWQPISGGYILKARVGYSDANDKYELADEDYQPYDFKMEYRLPFFPGLKESTDRNAKEKVTIMTRGVEKRFFVRKVIKKYDGATCIAYLEEISS